jgi:hypothetical protein
VKWAWWIGLTFLPISYGWAAGDVSLAAYIQSSLNGMDINEPGISPLGAVMSFLYSSYIVLYAVLSSALGKIMDHDKTTNGNIISSLTRVGGIQFSICCVVILLSTLVPRGSHAFNPKPVEDLHTKSDDAPADHRKDEFRAQPGAINLSALEGERPDTARSDVEEHKISDSWVDMR